MIIRTKVLFSTSACSVFLVGYEEYYFALDVAKKQGEKFGLCYIYRRVVSSVGRAPVCRGGGRGFKPRQDQNSGSLNNWEESAAFVMRSANG